LWCGSDDFRAGAVLLLPLTENDTWGEDVCVNGKHGIATNGITAALQRNCNGRHYSGGIQNGRM
jgi:hypothetical protein